MTDDAPAATPNGTTGRSLVTGRRLALLLLVGLALCVAVAWGTVASRTLHKHLAATTTD